MTGTVNYIEPQYIFSQGALNTATSKFVNYPLAGFRNTIFAYDKDLCFGNEMF